MMSIPESEQTFGSTLTISGENVEVNAKLNKKPYEFAYIAIGDAHDEYVQPSRTQTGLVNEVARLPVSSVEIIQPSDEHAPPQLQITAVVPNDFPDMAVREFAAISVYDGNQYYHAIGNCPRIPILSAITQGGEGYDYVIQMTFVVTSVDQIVMVDPHIVTASRQFVLNQFKAHVEEAHPHAQYAFSGTQIITADVKTHIIRLGAVHVFTEPAEMALPVADDGQWFVASVHSSVDLKTGECVFTAPEGETINHAGAAVPKTWFVAKNQEFRFVRINGEWCV
ncbi:TPA: phage tail protein [Vibrio vulnificus]|uniref:phage tail-collar fiber domain-containing protein n=2 Tax=Vibrio vulnificus TaxID=672 RepID=UPI00376817B3